jgi:hypothetical protein
MEMAEQAGVFNGPVKSLYHLEKAARDRDQVPMPLSLANPDLAPPADRPASEMDEKTLRALCKEGGMNTFGKSRREMEQFIDSGQQF